MKEQEEGTACDDPRDAAQCNNKLNTRYLLESDRDKLYELVSPGKSFF
jgi:hypothetical protein